MELLLAKRLTHLLEFKGHGLLLRGAGGGATSLAWLTSEPRNLVVGRTGTAAESIAALNVVPVGWTRVR